MDKNKNCSACNIKLDINNYKKDRTICRDCYNKKKKKPKLTLYLQIKFLLLLKTLTFQHYWLVLVFQVKPI